jgi:RimJ/RimL family protein N-acetyltransferase
MSLKRIVAITLPENQGSIRVLERIGLKFEKMVKLAGDEVELMLFASDM